MGFTSYHFLDVSLFQVVSIACVMVFHKFLRTIARETLMGTNFKYVAGVVLTSGVFQILVETNFIHLHIMWHAGGLAMFFAGAVGVFQLFRRMYCSSISLFLLGISLLASMNGDCREGNPQVIMCKKIIRLWPTLYFVFGSFHPYTQRMLKGCVMSWEDFVSTMHTLHMSMLKTVLMGLMGCGYEIKDFGLSLSLSIACLNILNQT
eukprot:PhF_6_TR40892/c0_g1_i1/m.61842